LREDRIVAELEGNEGLERKSPRRSPWELAVLCGAVGFFLWLAAAARPQQVAVDLFWMIILIAIALAFLVGGGVLLWRRTRFS
jgi:hypothetical protein